MLGRSRDGKGEVGFLLGLIYGRTVSFLYIQGLRVFLTSVYI
jgi:hypothetical protein